MSKPGYETAVAIGTMFGSNALLIANARRTGVFNGKKIEGRFVDTSGDLAAALLLLDSAAYHISAIYSRRAEEDFKGQPGGKRKVAQTRDAIRNGICRWTSEMHEFFYPGHKHSFVSTNNPWLVENTKTHRALKLLLPRAIVELASVVTRRKGTWEAMLINDMLSQLVVIANDLIHGMPGKPEEKEVFHADKIGEFRAAHRGFVGTDVKAHQAQWMPHKMISPEVSTYLGSKLNTLKWEISENDGEVVKAQGDIVRIGGRAYLVVADTIKMQTGYQQVPGELQLL
ncbi:hypothetical protein SM033_00287 [Vibrio phage vB_VpaM_sm033]|nr:hypothetical protein SM033_00287 [Vibrio phage vB_VpaM_sm033]